MLEVAETEGKRTAARPPALLTAHQPVMGVVGGRRPDSGEAVLTPWVMRLIQAYS